MKMLPPLQTAGCASSCWTNLAPKKRLPRPRRQPPRIRPQFGTLAAQPAGGGTRYRLFRLSADGNQPAVGQTQSAFGLQIDCRCAGRMAGVFLLGRTVFEKSTAQAAALCFTRQPCLPLRRRAGCRIADLSRPRQRSQSERTRRSRLYRYGFCRHRPPPRDSAPKPPAFSTWERSVTATTWKPCAKVFGNF